MLSYVLLFCRLVIAAVFAISFVEKYRDRQAFRATLHRLRVLPARLDAPTLYAVLALEATIPLQLLARPTLTTGFILAAVLLVAFSVALMLMLKADIRADCNCFGSRSRAPVRRAHVLRNLALLAVCAVGILLQGSPYRAAFGPLEPLAGFATVVFGVVCVLSVLYLDDILEVVSPLQPR